VNITELDWLFWLMCLVLGIAVGDSGGGEGSRRRKGKKP